MQTECSADLFGFGPVEGRAVVAAFDGGAMLLGATDGQLRLIERFAGCFTDHRTAGLVEHSVPGLVGPRVFGIALGYEDLIDHDQLRHDPVTTATKQNSVDPFEPRYGSCRWAPQSLRVVTLSGMATGAELPIALRATFGRKRRLSHLRRFL
jgi:hypothetical protein